MPVIAAPGATRYLQPAVSRSLPDRTNQKPVLEGGVLLSRLADHGAAADVAHALGKSNGKVPDEWIFNFQDSLPSIA
ncbi:MAG: hypothetical protein U0I48_00725 [Acutalibacteraceae bacterium]|nr:hypothetical protein [Acutalibacteraceae bacterium]